MDLEKIVFIQPPVSLDEIYGGLAKVGAISPPLNLLLLASLVREKGFKPYIIDSPALGLEYRDIVKKLREIAPKYIGITAMTPHIIQANSLAEEIKKELPESIVLLGGTHISAMPEETMQRFPSMDIGFIGEADISLPELLDNLNKGKPASSVSGTISRENGSLLNTGQRSEHIDLNSLPLYAWDILEGYPSIYNASLFATHRRPATPILTSRGCPGKCIYCNSGCHKTISTHSAEYVIDMLRLLKERYGIKEFMLYDDNFVMFKKNLRELLANLIHEKIDMTWSCNARVDMVDEEIIKLMAEAGCWQISYGIETGNQAIMNRIGKKITKDQIRQTLTFTKMAGIRTVGYFMIGHFGETQETIDETVKFACDIDLDDFRMSFFTPLPGTRAALMAQEYGEFDNDWEKMNLFEPVFTPTGMTYDELARKQKEAIRKFFIRPQVVWSYLKMVKNPRIALRGAYELSKYVFEKG